MAKSPENIPVSKGEKEKDTIRLVRGTTMVEVPASDKRRIARLKKDNYEVEGGSVVLDKAEESERKDKQRSGGKSRRKTISKPTNQPIEQSTEQPTEQSVEQQIDNVEGKKVDIMDIFLRQYISQEELDKINKLSPEVKMKKLAEVLGVERRPDEPSRAGKVVETSSKKAVETPKEFFPKYFGLRIEELKKEIKAKQSEIKERGKSGASPKEINDIQILIKEKERQIETLKSNSEKNKEKWFGKGKPKGREKESLAVKNEQIEDKDVLTKEKELTKKQWKEAKALYGQLLMGKEGYSEEDVETILSSSVMQPIIENFYRNRQKEQGKDSFEKKLEKIQSVYDNPAKEYQERLVAEKQKRIENIRAQLLAAAEVLKEKPKSQFEEFEESVNNASYEKVRDAYLGKLGWGLKYDFLHLKAWIVDNATGKFLNKNGEPTDKKKDRISFSTQWGFSVETPFFKFLRAQVEKKLGGTQSSVETKPSSKEENLGKGNEQFGEYYAALQEEIRKAEGIGDQGEQAQKQKEDEEKWEKIHGPGGMAEVRNSMSESDAQEIIQRTQKKKPKSFWRKVEEFLTKEL